MKVLIFPSNTLEAILKAKEFKSYGYTTIGASSVNSEYSLTEFPYDIDCKLPFITDEKFKDRLNYLLEKYSIKYIWSSIISVNENIEQYLNDKAVKILSISPVLINQELLGIISQQTKERRTYSKDLCYNFGIKKIPSFVLSNLLTAIMKVPGESHFDKLFTIAHIFPTIPQKYDIVEIGSLWGRTAKAFCCFSHFFDKGNVLCIDPWSKGLKTTQDTHKIIDSLSLNYDESIFHVFVSNLMAEHRTRINYIRGYSSEVKDKYFKSDGTIVTDEFGRTYYNKKIGLLHLDGNHKYENVTEDINNFAKEVISGGWIIFDDYNWKYGNGVKEASDRYLEENIKIIKQAFYSGGALFVNLK